MNKRAIKNNRVLHIDGVGRVVLVRSLRAKRMNIRIKAFEDIRVAVPKGVSYVQAEQFVYQKLDWLKTHHPKVKTSEARHTIFDEQTTFQTRQHTLRIVRKENGTLSVRTVRGEILVHCPRSIDIRSDEAQQAIRGGIEQAWRKEAKVYLPKRVEALAREHGFTYEKLFIKNIKSRWGSCSHVNNINLSLHLMRLPEHLIDYVILHELAHTVEKNHGYGFETLLRKVCPRANTCEAELKQHNIKLY